MTKHLLLLGLLACNMATEAVAQESCCKKEKAECPEKTEDVAAPQSRFTIGGYGEAAMSRNFYS